MKILRITALAVSVCLLAFAVAVWFHGRPSVESADQVDVYALDGDSSLPIGQPSSFPLRPYGRSSKIVGWKSLIGADAEYIVRLWSSQDFDDTSQAMCHIPVYGLRFFREGRLIFETSICWKCNNYYSPTLFGTSWRGFRAQSEQGQALLNKLKELLPNQAIDDLAKKLGQDG